jgi:hypothetical protein
LNCRGAEQSEQFTTLPAKQGMVFYPQMAGKNLDFFVSFCVKTKRKRVDK